MVYVSLKQLTLTHDRHHMAYKACVPGMSLEASHSLQTALSTTLQILSNLLRTMITAEGNKLLLTASHTLHSITRHSVKDWASCWWDCRGASVRHHSLTKYVCVRCLETDYNWLNTILLYFHRNVDHSLIALI